jgi:hypothetical protein
MLSPFLSSLSRCLSQLSYEQTNTTDQTSAPSPHSPYPDHTLLTLSRLRRSASVTFQSGVTVFGFVANVARGKCNFDIHCEGKVILESARQRYGETLPERHDVDSIEEVNYRQERTVEH